MFLKTLTIAAFAAALAASAASAKPAPGPAHKRAHHHAARLTPKAKPRVVEAHDYLPDIRAAQATLEKMKALEGGFDWLLAVRKRGEPLMIVRASSNGNNNRALAIRVGPDHGVATRFEVTRPEGYVVLAQKSRVRTRTGFGEAVYTAYDPAFDTPLMRSRGLAYLQDVRADGYAELKRLGVPSIAVPGKRVSAVVPRKTALVIMITEHVDPFRAKYVGVRQCVREVLVTVAANRDAAYAYAKSSAEARGLMQFVPQTYAMVRDNYPAAQLHPDFIDGMRDHRNAARAAIALFDLELAALPESKRAWFLRPKGDRYAAAYLAAAYNWNATKVARAYVASLTKPVVVRKRGKRVRVRPKPWMSGLPAETRKYVEIQRQVADALGV